MATAAASPSLLARQLRLLRSSTLLILWTHLFWSKCYSVGDTIGASMLPTINVANDWILISKFHVRGRRVRVGDLVSYAHPVDGPDVNVVKRVIGLPGDFVVKDPSDGSGDMLQVPRGHVWTTGDNLPHSMDSRMYGPVPLALVKGKVLGRVWPDPTWFKNPLANR